MASRKLKGTTGESLPKNYERRERWIAKSEDADALEQELVDCVAQGESLHAWCKRNDFPYTTVREWIDRVPNRRNMYETARIARAEWHVADIESMLTEVRRGELDPSAARVIAENKRWIASRMDPHLWGEKVQINADINIGQRYLDAIKGLTIDGEWAEVIDEKKGA
jgi:CCR4-NOT transcriptional regulation complex NOT5 subunit